MVTGKNPDFVIIDEVSSLVEADFAELERRVFNIPNYQLQAMQHFVGMDYGTEFHPNGRPKFKPPEPDKRAKTKAARKQRRKQK